MDMYQMSKEEVLSKLHTKEEGLDGREAGRRQETYGYNELADVEKKPVWRIFLEQFKDFLVLILIVAALVSGILGDWESAGVIFLVIIMNAVLGTVQHTKAEKSLSALKKLSGPHAKVLRDGAVTLLPSREVVPGDILVMEAGDYVPADGRILMSASLKADESTLTGESLPVEKKDVEIPKEAVLGDRVNMLFSGSFITYGRGTVVVTATGMETEVGRIAALLKSTKEHETPLQQSMDAFGRRISILILAICALLFGLSVWRGESIMQAFLFAVALAVAAIPEALSSIVTIVLAFGTRKMSRENAIIRKLSAVEGLGSVSVICSDKTGTLTQNRMTAIHLYVPHISKKIEKTDLNREPERLLVTAGVLCNDATSVNGEDIGDPTELAFLHMLDKMEGAESPEEIRAAYRRIGEVPFDSDRKLMSTLHRRENIVTMITKGAVDVLLTRTDRILEGTGIRSITEEDKAEILRANEEYSGRGLRVLAFGYKTMEENSIYEKDEEHLVFLGMCSMIDPPREESKAAVADCKKAGIRPIMITGDHAVTASAIAGEIGILTEGKRTVTGEELEKLTDEELKDMVEDVAVYARVSPEHKIRIVKAWQQRGNIVAMTGDGVNDAPALKQADVGVAMGITGTEVAKDAASMILADDNFATIVKAVENGRNVYRNIRKSIVFLLSGNMAGILAVLITFLAGTEVPFAAVHLLFINLLTDSLPAIALGLDPHTGEVMGDKPRRHGESVLTGSVMITILAEGLVIALATISAYFIGLKAGGPGLASTMAFATLCLSRLVHGFNCKSERPVLFTRSFYNNKFLWFAFLAGFLMLNLVLLVPVLHPVFAVTALSLRQLLTVYGLAALNLPVIQLLKLMFKGKAND
jgi:P-type Ca2+ transporter type 2C